jgi:hypothetical protein
MAENNINDYSAPDVMVNALRLSMNGSAAILANFPETSSASCSSSSL